MAGSFFTELKRRNVFKVGVAYLVLAWVVVQVTDTAVPALHLPEWVNSLVFFLGAIGFPFALFFAWAFEITPEGIKKESDITAKESIAAHTGRKLDFIIIGALLLIISFILYTGSFDLSKDTPEVSKTVAVNKSIAVLPFVNMSSNEEYEWFSDGLTEEILNSLAMLQELQVTARTSSFYFKGKNLPVQEIAKELNVEYVVEGSVRPSGETLRITAQLIRASDDSHLWSNTYDRPADDVLTVQREVAESIAEALDVILDDKRREQMFASGTRNVAAFEAFHQGIASAERAHSNENPTSLWRANEYFLEAIAADPKFAAPHIQIQDAYTHYLMEGPESVFLKSATPEGLTPSKALTKLQYHLEKAVELARTEDAKFATKVALTFQSNNWSDLHKLLNDLKADPTLANINTNSIVWLVEILNALGEEATLLPQLEEVLSQNPYARLSWFYLIHHLVANANFDEAAKIIEQSKKYNFYNEANLIRVYVQSNNQAELDELYEQNINSGTEISLQLLAATGRVEEALKKLELEGIDNYSDRNSLRLYYLLGDQETANNLAIKIDNQPLGALVFAQYIGVHGRIDASKESLPNYVRKLRQAGLSEEKINSMFLASE